MSKNPASGCAFNGKICLLARWFSGWREFLHMQSTIAVLVVKSDGCIVVRQQPLNAGLNCGEHLPDVRIGQYCFAEFKKQRLLRPLAICEVARDFGKSDEVAVRLA